MDSECLAWAHILKDFNAPKLKKMGPRCLEFAAGLISFKAPMLEKMGGFGLYDCKKLQIFNAPLVKMPPPYIKERVQPKPTSHGFGRGGISFGNF